MTLELPEAIAASLGPPEAASATAREMVAIEPLREVRICQSMTAQLLEITRWDVIDLMAEHQILSGPETPEELRHELDGLRRYSNEHRAGGGDQ